MSITEAFPCSTCGYSCARHHNGNLVRRYLWRLPMASANCMGSSGGAKPLWVWAGQAGSLPTYSCFCLNSCWAPESFLLEHIWVSFCPQLDAGSIRALSRFSWEQLRAETLGKLLGERTFTSLEYCVSRGAQRTVITRTTPFPVLLKQTSFLLGQSHYFLYSELGCFVVFNGFINGVCY